MRIAKALPIIGLGMLCAHNGYAELLVARPGEQTAPPTLLSKLMSSKAAAETSGGAPCSTVGQWTLWQSGTDLLYDVIVNEDLTGTMATHICPVPHILTVTPTGLDTFSAQAAYSGPQPEGATCISVTMAMQFAADCETAKLTAVYGQAFDGDAGWIRGSKTVVPSPRYIPANAVVQNKKVRIASDLTITLRDAAGPIQGTSVLLQSSRGVADEFDGPNSPTDALGKTTAVVSTITAPGTSTISIASPPTAQGGHVTFDWLPATWWDHFLITCYVVAQEGDYAETPTNTAVPGLPGMTLRQKFVDDARMQGSGVTLDGTYIHYDGGGRFSTQTCALTASGSCAVDGVTAAVDPATIPFRSTIGSQIFGGDRVALDTGDRIKGHHIDEYYGTRRTECLQRGARDDQVVKLIHYKQ